MPPMADTPTPGPVRPGDHLLADEPTDLSGNRDLRSVRALNAGDRPVQVGSHFRFAETNDALEFDRPTTVGFRLAIPAGTSTRFEPGVPTEVTLVEFAGRQVTPGFRGLYRGAT